MSEQNETEDTIGEVQPRIQGAELKEGTHIDRYQILGLLGKGGMGAVYKAYDPELDRSIAIKILTVRPYQGETASRPQARLMREAQALAKLSHPNVVSVFDVGTYEEGVYIAMEYVKGKTLREWLKGEKKTKKEILGVLSKAGQGLQAAHTEGIVHRDFKPDNVIIGDRGQVKVLDFGLARAAGAEDTAVLHKKQESVEDASSGEKLLSKPLTRAGAIIGTTVYMAPEHFAFRELDEKTDQFSFCVTLFEALFGQRPFIGSTSDELKKRIISGKIDIPQEADVPKWLESILLRGLSISKDDRYESMLELLDALEDDPAIAKARRHKQHLMASIILLLTALTLGFGYYAVFRSAEICTGADGKVAGIWNDERKEKINQAFAETGAAHARPTIERIRGLIDNYVQRWGTQYDANCTATLVDGGQSERLMDLRARCLQRNLGKVGELLGVLSATPEATMANRAIKALLNLTDLSGCEDDAALAVAIPLPTDPESRAKVVAKQDLLDRLASFEELGLYERALKESEGLIADTRDLDYPLVGEALFRLASLKDRVGEWKEAEILFKRSALAASAAGIPETVARAWTRLLWVSGFRLRRAPELLQHQAQVAVGLAGNKPAQRAWLHNYQGAIAFGRGEYQQASEQFRKSANAWRLAVGEHDPNYAKALNNIAAAVYDLGDWKEASALVERALQIWLAAYGEDHPDVALARNNLGDLYKELGRYHDSAALVEGAIATWEKTVGAQSAEMALALNNLCDLLVVLGRHKASGTCQRALAVNTNVNGGDHFKTATAHVGLAHMLSMNGESDTAFKHLETALSIQENKLGHSNRHTINTVLAMTRILINTRKLTQAARSLQRVHSNMKTLAAADQSHPALRAKVLIYDGWLGLETGQHALAQKKLREAIGLLKDDRRPEAISGAARARFLLARALWPKPGSRPEALALACRSNESYSKVGSAVSDEQHGRIRAWLASRDIACHRPPTKAIIESANR